MKIIKTPMTLLLTFSFILLMAVPAWASDDNTDPTASYYTLSQIQQMAVKQNRISDKINTGLDLLEQSKKALKNGMNTLNSGTNTLNNTYSSAAAKTNAALAQIDAALSKLNTAMAADPALAADRGLEAQKMLLEFEKQQLTTNVSLTGLSAQSVGGILDSAYDDLNGQYLDYDAQADDLEKSSQDVDNQIRMVCGLLFTKTKELEKSIDLLTEKHQFQLKLYEVEQVKMSIGYTTITELETKKQEAAQTALQLQEAQNGLKMIKRQINNLIGHPLDQELQLAEYVVGEGIIDEVPVYNSKLVSEITDKSYAIQALERDIKNYRRQIGSMKVKDSNKKQALEYCIDLKELAIIDAEQDLANEVKKKIDNIKLTGDTYEQKIQACANAKTKLKNAQTSLALGLISPLEFRGAELVYKQAELAKSNAGYAYYLAWQEYDALANGKLTDIYQQYKTALQP
jgi:hypothetical protein